MPRAKKASASKVIQPDGEAKTAHNHTHASSTVPQPGDKVLITCSDCDYIGILLPAKENSTTTPLKLPSGYNIGVKNSRIKAMELVQKRAPLLPTAGATPAKEKEESPKGKTAILAVGGTIASRIDYHTGAVYPATTPEQLLASFPSIPRDTIKARTLFSLLSEDLSPLHWQKIAEAAAHEIKGGAEGVVVTHGTDTMSYTSAALSFMLQNLPCPVILTGSQRSSDRGSSDSELNLRSSLIAAKADLSGVFVCMHEDLSDESCALHFGTKVRKMHTTRRDAFRSINTLPAARIFPAANRLEKISERALPRQPGASVSLDARLNPNVAMLYTYPGMLPKAISSLSDYDGVVLAGTGLGHIPLNLSNNPLAMPIFKEVKGLIGSGIAVVLCSQTIYGRVNMNVYANGRLQREAGIIGHLCDLTPEAAYVKLMWVLGHEKKQDKVRNMMETNIAGEITDRSDITNY